ncbi:MAG: SPOR domain-containing protein [Acidiferrobacterales bacterium]
MAAKRKKSATRRKKTAYRRRPAARRGPRKLPNWSLLVLGLAIGVVVAVLVQWIIATVNKPGTGLNNILTRPDKPGTKSRPVAAKPPQKTKYDFYTILPEGEAVVEDSEWQDISRTREADVSYVLQAAAYNRYADADRLKARLAINGLASEIQKITADNERVYYRVRLGPYNRASDAEDANRKLARMGIKALRLKVRN